MQLTPELINHFIQEELILRQEIEAELILRRAMIQELVSEHCESDSESYLSREEWQDFCFRKLTGKTCHTNIPFSTYLNNLMPELGYPLGYAHTKVRVYRGLKWKVKH